MRPRFYCDHCKVSKGTSQSMKKHETGCTANPSRECRMCLMEGVQAPLPELMAVFDGYASDDPSEPFHWTQQDERTSQLRARLTKLRELCSNCPACVLAVLRQRKISTSPDDFDWKKESKKWLSDHPHYEPPYC